jgi:hypothetical protein
VFCSLEGKGWVWELMTSCCLCHASMGCADWSNLCMVCGLCPPPQLAGNTNVTSADSSTLAAGTVNNPGICSNPITVGATEVGLCGAACISHELAHGFLCPIAPLIVAHKEAVHAKTSCCCGT